MDAPGQTYGYRSAIDTAGPTFQLYNRNRISSAAASTHVFTIEDIPKDKVLILTNVSIGCVPSVLQWVRDIFVAGFTQAQQPFQIAQLRPPVDAGVQQDLNWTGSQYIVGAGNGLRSVEVLIRFNVGTLANTSETGISGIIIPRGNVAAW